MDLHHVGRVANAIWNTAVREADGDVETLCRAFTEAHVQVVVAAKYDPALIDELLQEYTVAFKRIFISRCEAVQ